MIDGRLNTMTTIFVQPDQALKATVKDNIVEEDLFYKEIRRAIHILSGILQSFEPSVDNVRDKDDSYYSDFQNNIIAFSGERGNGKTSTMLTFISLLQKHNKKVIDENDIIKQYDFSEVVYIDPTALDGVYSILDILLAKMFQKISDVWETNKNRDIRTEDNRIQLTRLFQRVYRELSLIKDSNSILEEEFDEEVNITGVQPHLIL